VDPEGLDALVIFGDPTGSGVLGGNPFGHVAIGFTDCGCVFSFGTGDPLGIGLKDYLRKQSKYRNSTVYRINTTPAQDNIMRSELRKKMPPLPDVTGDPAGAWSDTCATRVRNAILAAGIWLPPVSRTTPFPNDLEIGVRMISNGRQRFHQEPKGPSK
jgi:hypothetical protein